MPDYQPSFNIAPTETALILAQGKEGLTFTAARFGLVPSWANDLSISSRLLNARSETIETTKAYSSLFKRRHCLVVTSGFYEWRQEGSVKQPYLFDRADGEPLMIAGLWDYWKPEGEAEGIVSFTIITTEPNSLMRDYHNRMPVTLDNAEYMDWLDSKPDKSVLDAFP